LIDIGVEESLGIPHGRILERNAFLIINNIKGME